MTQLRVRQGLDGVRCLLQKENRLEAKVALESMKYDVDTNRAIPTLRIDAGPRIQVNSLGAKVSQEQAAPPGPDLRRARRGPRPAGGGRAQSARLFPIAGIFRSQVEFKQQKVINDKADVDFLVNNGKAPQAGGDHDSRQPLLFHRRDPRAHVPANGQSSAVPARPLQRKPGAPRPGQHRQPLPVERIPRRQGDARTRSTISAARWAISR